MSGKAISLVLPILFLISCGKSGNTPAPSLPKARDFAITGMTDITLGITPDNALTLSIKPDSAGPVEAVTISVSGLPAGIVADIQPATDSPTFTSTIVFNQHRLLTPGTYTVQIKGSSASYAHTYNVNLIATDFNGFILHNKLYYTSSISYGYGAAGANGCDVWTIDTLDHVKSARLYFHIGPTWPTSGGPYTYAYPGANDFNVYINDDSAHSGSFNPYGGTPAVVSIINRKMQLRIDSASVYNNTRNDFLIVNAHD